jgi:cellulase/cellobiase CelA1
MNRLKSAVLILVILAFVSVTVLAACASSGSSSTSSPTPSPTSSINAQALMSQQCSRCHPISRVTSKTKTPEQWKVTLDRMIRHGAKLTSAEEQALVDYLAQTY